MAEYIEKEALMVALCKEITGDGDYYNGKDDMQDQIRDMVSQFPAADVAPVRHGRWIKDNNSLQTDDYYCCYFDYNCSECGKVVNNRYELPKYCPNCGAKMNG